MLAHENARKSAWRNIIDETRDASTNGSVINQRRWARLRVTKKYGGMFA